jgi:hypothetical protein
MFKFLRPSYWLSLALAFLTLPALSRAQAGSTLNLNFSPFDGGNSTLVSWTHGGDIITENGDNFSLFFLGGGRGPEIVATGLFSSAYRATLLPFIPPVTPFLSPAYPSAVFAVQGGTYSNVGAPSSQQKILNITFGVEIAATLLAAGLSYYDTGRDAVRLSFDPDPTDSVNDPQETGLSGDQLRYTANVDSVVIPLAFDSFNPGTYNADLNWNQIPTVIDVVPEPSTYALFGFGALILLAVNRRRKSRN